MPITKITPTCDRIHLGRTPGDFYLPTERRNPGELFFFSYKYFAPKSVVKATGVPPFSIERKLALAKNVTDVDFSYALCDREEYEVVSVIPYQALQPLFNSIPTNPSKTQSIFAMALGIDPFGGVLSKKLFCVIFDKGGEGGSSRQEPYETKWVRAPNTTTIVLLAKLAKSKLGKLVGIVPETIIKDMEQQANKLLKGDVKDRLVDLVYDFRELDGDKAMNHSFSREYPELTPQEIADRVTKEGHKIAQAMKNKGVEVKLEQSEREAYNELLRGVALARLEELKNCYEK